MGYPRIWAEKDPHKPAVIMAGVGEFVTRKGIYPPIPDADKIELVQMIDLDKKGYAEKMAEYRKIFLQR